MDWYIKDFDSWNHLKNRINDRKISKLFYKEKEIWWSSLGVNVGTEMDGKNDSFERPVLVLKKINKNQFFAAPMTTKIKKGRLYFKLSLKDADVTTTRFICLAQVRIMSSKRLLRKVEVVDVDLFRKVRKSYIKLLS